MCRVRGPGLNFCFSSAVLIALISVLINYFSQATFLVPPKHGAVLISGASTGIGRHAAESLARNNFDLVFAGVRKEGDAKAIRALGIPSLVPVILDVANRQSVLTFFVMMPSLPISFDQDCLKTVQAELTSRHLPLVGLVNNAGIAYDGVVEQLDVGLVNNAGIAYHSLVEHLAIDKVRDMFEVNFHGAVSLTQVFLPLLRASQGRIVMISSMAGLTPSAVGSTYGATKAALDAFSTALRLEMQPFGVSVSIVNPAYVKTPILGKGVEQRTKENWIAGNAGDNEVYASLKRAFAEFEQRGHEHGDDPQVTTDVITDALISPTPKTQYICANVEGTPAWILARLAWLVPSRVTDMVYYQITGIPSKPPPPKASYGARA